jgi:hypothetical protein
MRARDFISGLITTTIAALALLATPATAQLREAEVLVVFDSRLPDSAAVARHYAGSAKVPGGSTFEPGVRPRVNVFDLASTGLPTAAANTLAYPDFQTNLRDPIRAHLTSRGLTRTVRAIVLTKGLAHRIDDTDNTGVGDRPSDTITEANNSDITAASVDSELTLLWQNLAANELGGLADSLADGLIANPVWRVRTPVGLASTANNRSIKAFATTNPLPVRTLAGAGALRLTQGDILLVSRLDGPTVQSVRTMVERARSILYDTDEHAILLDASASNNVADPSPNAEIDNAGGAPFTPLYGGDDYERSRDALVADGRWLPARITYDQFGGQFFVGPLLPYTTPGNVITRPLALLATYGSNHGGTIPTGPNGLNAASTYAESFSYPNGAIFNTIESFNGRAFGTLTEGDIIQEQARDFIAAGGTFAIGYVWEPFSATVADNEQLALNFLLGRHSWAEAAWSSIPCLSWMHIVLGDPVARPWRTREDLRADATPTIDDLYSWERRPPSDPAKNINRAGTADDADRQILARSLRWAERADLINARP